MRWILFYFGLLVVSVSPDIEPSAKADGPSGQLPALQVRFENGLLSVSAQNISLQDLLAAIGRASGIEVEVHGEEGQQRVSQSIVDRLLADALTELLNGRNYLLLYKWQGKDKRISKVILSASTSPSAPVTAHSPEPQSQQTPDLPRSRTDADEPRQQIPQDQSGAGGSPPAPPPGPPAGVATQPTSVAPIQPASPFPYLNVIQRQQEAR